MIPYKILSDLLNIVIVVMTTSVLSMTGLPLDIIMYIFRMEQTKNFNPALFFVSKQFHNLAVKLYKQNDTDCFSNSGYLYAIETNSLELFRWTYDNKFYNYDPRIGVFLAKYDDFEIIQKVAHTHISVTEFSLRCAVINRNWAFFDVCLSNYSETVKLTDMSSKLYRWCIKYEFMKLFERLYELKIITIDKDILKYIIQHGNLDFLKYFVSNKIIETKLGADYLKQICSYAADYQQMSILKWGIQQNFLYSKGDLLNEIVGFADDTNRIVLQWCLKQPEFKFDLFHWRGMDLSILKWAVKNKIPCSDPDIQNMIKQRLELE